MKINYIAHHGIKGQKHGVRNGPPYPLTQSAKARAYGQNQSLAAAAVAAAVLTVAMVAKVSIDERRILKRREADAKRSNVNDERKAIREGEEIDPETGLYLKKEPGTIEEDLAAVNPGYGSGNGFGINCSKCTATMDMRLRGYDVVAKQTREDNKTDYEDSTLAEHEKWYKPPRTSTEVDFGDTKSVWDLSGDEEWVEHGKKVRSSIEKTIVSQGEGARGELCLAWLGDTGHSMMWQVEDGKAIIYDAQVNKKTSIAEMPDNLMETASYAYVRRTDDLEPDIEYMKTRGIFE